MTIHLSCREAELLTLEGEDRKLSPGEQGLIEGHLRGCERCRAFAADRRTIRGETAALRWPAPPERLVRETRRRLREGGPDARTAGLPAWVLIATGAVAIAMTLWLAVSLANVSPDMTLADLPVPGLAAVLIIVQNALMLLFAPIVLRTVRARRGASGSV